MVLNDPDGTRKAVCRLASRQVTSDRAEQTFKLIPRGADDPPDAPHRLAGCGGHLVGAIVEGGVCTWLAHPNGQLVLIMWPKAFRARFDPLELLDEQGQTVATGGEFITAVGGYLPERDTRSMGHKRVFAAWKASRGHPTRR